MSKALDRSREIERHATTIRLAFVADASESTLSEVLAACTAVGPDVVKAQAIQGAKFGTSKKVTPEKWAHQMSTAAALLVLVWEDGADLDADRVAQDCITRAKASSKSTTDCKAKGTGNKLVGAVSKMIEEKSQKAARADIRKAQGSTRGGSRGARDKNATPALVKAVETKIAAFEEAHKNSSTRTEAKASELLKALRLLEKIEKKATGAMVTLEVASGE